MHVLALIHMAAADTSAASSPLIQNITQIAGGILLAVIIFRGVMLYAKKEMRGEIVAEILAAILAAGMVFNPASVITVAVLIWNWIAGFFGDLHS